MGFFRDSRYEQWLDRLQAEWKFVPNVPIAAIDEKASLANQARIDKPLDRDRAMEYGVLMLDGVDFPALIAFKAGNGKYNLITGNHRFAGAKDAGFPTVDVYHVLSADTDLYLRDIMTRTANIVEGVAPTKDERIAQALYMVQATGHPASEVAKLFGVGSSTLSQHLRRIQTDRRLLQCGLAPEKLNKETRYNLGRIINDNVLTRVAKLIVDANLGDKEALAIIVELERLRTEADQVLHIEEQRTVFGSRLKSVPSRNGRVTTPVQSQLLAHVREANRILRQYHTPTSLHLTNRDSARNLIDAVRELNSRSEAVVRLLTEQMPHDSTSPLVTATPEN